MPTPVVDFIWQSVASNPLIKKFMDKSKGFNTASGGGTTWQWNFGDGSPVSGAYNPQHTFPAAGNYTVTLTVLDPPGSTPASHVVAVP